MHNRAERKSEAVARPQRIIGCNTNVRKRVVLAGNTFREPVIDDTALFSDTLKHPSLQFAGSQCRNTTANDWSNPSRKLGATSIGYHLLLVLYGGPLRS